MTCANGHKRTEENTYKWRDQTKCRLCRKDAARAFRAANPYPVRRTDRWRKHYADNKAEHNARAMRWAAANKARLTAYRRLKLLRSKKDPCPGEVAQMADILRQFPKRRFVYTDRPRTRLFKAPASAAA